MKTIVALYDELKDAYQTIEELRDAGLDRSNVSLVTGDPEGEYAPYFRQAGGERDEPIEGALAGGAIGGIAGLLLGLGALAIPGIGPVVAAGPLVSGLIGAGIGAASGGLLGALVKAGIPEEEAGYYLEGVRRGGTLLAVRVMSYQADEVLSIMERNNPVDLDERVELWREAGWTGFDTEAETSATNTARRTLPEEERERFATKGPLTSTEYNYEDEYERAFRQHYETHYAPYGRSYQAYAPAYHHGYQLALDTQDRDRDWEEIESEAQRLWEEDRHGTWEQFKDAVQYGWEEVTAMLEDEEALGNRRFNENDDERPRFRTHYDQTYASRGYDYAHYEPAYRFGYLLADDMRYQDRPWDEIEPVVRERWERDHVGDRPWEEVKGAIQHAWEAAQEPEGSRLT